MRTSATPRLSLQRIPQMSAFIARCKLPVTESGMWKANGESFRLWNVSHFHVATSIRRPLRLAFSICVLLVAKGTFVTNHSAASILECRLHPA